MLGGTEAIGLGAGHETQRHSMMPGNGGPRRLSGPAARHRHGVEGGCAYPHGGGVALRLPVGNERALCKAGPGLRTRHEFWDDRRAAAPTYALTLDDMHAIVPASMADTLPLPAMVVPSMFLRAFARRSVCFRIAAIRNAVAFSIHVQRAGKKQPFSPADEREVQSFI